MIAVTGCRRALPPEFPLEMPENAGNMIHANAPFEMFPGSVDSYDQRHWRSFGERSFADFVNANASHLVVTLANSLKAGDPDGTRYRRLQGMLEKIERPITIFGLGVQSGTSDLDQMTFPDEAVSLMRFLGDRCPVVGVRGRTTAEVFRTFAGVENTFVTGCPSFFSRPTAFERLPTRSPVGQGGRPAYAGTKLHLPDERRMLHDAVAADTFLVEPVNKFNHTFYRDASRGSPGEVPYFFKGYGHGLSSEQRRDVLAAYFRANYRLFRDPQSWYAFNEEQVSFTYGTRFHVNMASLLSGVPAAWVTHDARTRELVDFLGLPNVSIEEALGASPDEIGRRIDLREFLARVGGLFDNFNTYLGLHDLPQVPAPDFSRLASTATAEVRG